MNGFADQGLSDENFGSKGALQAFDAFRTSTLDSTAARID